METNSIKMWKKFAENELTISGKWLMRMVLFCVHFYCHWKLESVRSIVNKRHLARLRDKADCVASTEELTA